MTTKLKAYTFNTKKWRVENGLTTPEWEMYVNNVLFTNIVIVFLSIFSGILIGLGAQIS